MFKRKENFSPRSQTPAEAKSAYNQIQKGGDIPVSGLRMSLPERPRGNNFKMYLSHWELVTVTSQNYSA